MVSSNSPSPSPSSSSSTSSSANSQGNDTKNKITAKCLVEIPLVPLPSIKYNNLENLDNATFVNIVFESDTDNAFFRVSNESNKEVCRIVPYRQAEAQPRKKGVKYLECCDALGNCVLYVAYPVGLGEVALLSPTEELVGECQSNVEFICLSVKVKYNFYDINGKRLMKMTALMPEEGSADKFMLMVKRSKNVKLALIKMGSLKSCCQIKFKGGVVSLAERVQIIALWAGFMHNEIQDIEAPILLEKQAQAKLEEKESRRKKSLIANSIANNVVNGDNGESSPIDSHTNSAESRDIRHNNPPNNIEVELTDKKHKDTITKVKAWKNLVVSHLSRHQLQRDRGGQYGSNNNINDLNDDTRKSDITNFNPPPITSTE